MAAPREKHVFQAKFRLFSFDKTHHPLHLGVLESSKALLFGAQSVQHAVMAIWRKTEEVFCSGSSRLLVTVSAVDHVDFGSDVNKGTEKIKSEEVVLLCSQTFLSHYQIHEDEPIMLKLADVCPLKSVVFGAKTDISKHWAEQQVFSTGLLVSLCQKPILIRQGDVLLAPYSSVYDGERQFGMKIMFDLITLSCEPVAQGILSVNTEVIIVRLENNSLPVTEHHPKQKSPGTDTHDSPCILSDFANCLSNCSVTSSSPVANNSGSQTVFQIFYQDTSILARPPCDVPKSTLNCVVTEEKDAFFQKMISVSHAETLDSRNTVGLSSNTMKYLGLFNGSLVTLSCDKRSSKRKPIHNSSVLHGQEDHNCSIHVQEGAASVVERTAQVVLLSGAADNVVYMLPILWFNLSRDVSHDIPKQITIQKCMGRAAANTEDDGDEEEDDLTEVRSSYSKSWNEDLPYASEVHVALVHSPQYSAGAPVDTVLQKYFSTPRIVTKGDLIALSSEDDPSFAAAGGTDVGDVGAVVLYFEVKQVFSRGAPGGTTCLADVSHTSLFQDGSVHSYVPVRMTRLLCSSAPLSAPGMSSYVSFLLSLLQPHLKSRGASEILPVLLLSGPVGCGKSRVVGLVAEASNLHLLDVNCYELCGETSASAEAKIKASLIRARSCAPCILLLRNIHTLAKDRDGHSEDPRVAQSFQELVPKHIRDSLLWPIIVIATTSSPKSITSTLHQSFLHHVRIEVPDEATRRVMLSDLLQSKEVLPDIDVKHVAQRTAGFVLGDLEALVNLARRNAATRVQKHWFGKRWQQLSVQEEEDVWIAGVHLGQVDLIAALDQLQAAHSDAIGAPKIPSVEWADVGGLADVKTDILDTIQLPLEHPELFAAGLRRSGVLLYGPPGTGKTLLAKAVATECSLNFLSVKGPELINMYVGQSEENVREVFERARSAVPCVIFFDELDSLAPNRGRSGDSGGVMDRVVSQLLAELDGLHKSCDVFVIGATNRPDLLDPALLRPGRFDKLLYLGVSEDKPSQLKILQALTRKFDLAPSCHLDRVAERCPMNLTGADFYALCSDAMLNAIKRKIALMENGATSEDQNSIVVEEEDFSSALDSLVPSVSDAELAHYKSMQNFLHDQKT